MDKTEATMFIGMLALIIFGTALFDERSMTAQVSAEPAYCDGPNIIAPLNGQVFSNTENVPILVQSNSATQIHIINDKGYEQFYDGPKEMKFTSLQEGIYRIDAKNECGTDSSAFAVMPAPNQ